MAKLLVQLDRAFANLALWPFIRNEGEGDLPCEYDRRNIPLRQTQFAGETPSRQDNVRNLICIHTRMPGNRKSEGGFWEIRPASCLGERRAVRIQSHLPVKKDGAIGKTQQCRIVTWVCTATELLFDAVTGIMRFTLLKTHAKSCANWLR